ncbi:MAG: FAD:protein FMN transferase [Deltaproteobacteria bacterium]|jgi:thiamine biosynthesis lipoprotein ApbE|nr:FAD:protein FMN transferase [Deltaproteobacteria bacterium]
MFGRKHTKVEIRIPRLSGSADGPRFSANLVAAAAVKADRLLSPEGEGSDVERLNSAGAGKWVDADPVTMIAVKRALAWHHASEGLFEPAIGPVKALWDAAAASPGAPPEEREIASALELSRSSWLEPDYAGSRLSWKRGGCRLELGGIAEGVAVDLALETLASRGVEHASVRLGGAVASLGADTKTFPPTPWDKGILDPRGKALGQAARGGVPGSAPEWRAAAFCGYPAGEGGGNADGGGHAHGRGDGRGRVRSGERGQAGGRERDRGGPGEPGRCRCCGGCGRRFRLMDPVSGRPLPAGVSAAVYHPSSAADASAAAVVMSVLGPRGAERFLSEKGRGCFPEGVLALVFTPGPEGSLSTTSLSLDCGGKLSVSRTLAPPADRDTDRGSVSVPFFPLTALLS